MLKFEQVYTIDVSNWDEFVKNHYGKKHYSFQQQNGCQERGNYRINVDWIDKDCIFTNDEVELEINGDEMGVSLKSWIDAKESFFNDEFHERLFWERNFYPAVEEIVLDLYEKGLIPHKMFDIKIDW